MIKVVFTDMDGTLLDGKGKLPDWFGKLLGLLEQRQIIFAPCSGRQYLSLRETFRAYPQDEFLFVSENGGLVRYEGRDIFAAEFPRAKALALWQDIHAAKPEVCAAMAGRDYAYILQEQARGEFRDRLEYYGTHYKCVRAWSEVPAGLVHMAFYDPDQAAKDSLLPQLQKIAGDMQLLYDGSWLDILPAGSNKGAAIRAVQKELGIQPAECAAFGDYLNDAEMMTAVGHSFAMANALPEIKALARYQTASNEEAGVLKGIEWLLQQEK